VGAVNRFFKSPTSLLHSKERMTTYWPAFAAIVLTIIPNLLQALIFGASQAAGTGDDEDKMFSFQNEGGAKFSVDVTPIFRSFGKGFGKTKKRRVYLRWGKQAYEVFDGWLGGPDQLLNTLLGKSSSSVKIVMEQMTSQYKPGWDAPWKDKSFLGSMMAVDGNVWDGRIAGVVKKFLPMSITPFIDEAFTPGSGKPTSFFAPAKLGMSSYRAQHEIASVMRAYAEGGLKAQAKGVPNYERDLDDMVSEIMRAAELNGYDGKKVFGQGLSSARTFYYGQFFKGLQRNSESQMSKNAEHLIRIEAKYKNFKRSMKTRLEASGEKLKGEDARNVSNAWREGMRRAAATKNK